MTPRRVRVEEWGTPRGGDFVACYYESARRRYVVEWYVGKKPRRKTFAHGLGEKNTARRAAFVYGEELSKTRAGGATTRDRVRTTEELYSRYVLAMESGWRPATRTGNAARWRLWSAHFKPETPPDLVSEDTLDEFHAGLRAAAISPTQARATFALLRAVYRLGLRRGWVTSAVPLAYKARFAKDEVGQDPPEYTPDEWHRMLAVLDQGERTEWRLLAVLLLAGSQGQRINSIRHLRIDDFDLEGGTVTWCREWMKQGREFVQPLTPAGQAAFRVAMQWRERAGYQGQWLLPAARWKRRDQAVGYMTLYSTLLRIEQRAGVAHLPWRGFHGARRMVAENVYEGTGGDMLAAAAWLGDRDVKQMKSYLKRRERRLEIAAEAASAAAVEAMNHTRNHTQLETGSAETASE